MGRRAHRWTRAPSGRADEGGQADGGERACGRADGRTRRRTGGQVGGLADWGMGGRGRTSGRVGGLADWRMGGRGRTGGRRISEGRTPDLTRQLTWPWKIQCVRLRVTVKLPHLPPPLG